MPICGQFCSPAALSQPVLSRASILPLFHSPIYADSNEATLRSLESHRESRGNGPNTSADGRRKENYYWGKRRRKGKEADNRLRVVCQVKNAPLISPFTASIQGGQIKVKMKWCFSEPVFRWERM
jgi:hypothetical protein